MRELNLTLTYNYPQAIQQAIQLFTEETNTQVEVEVLEHQEHSALTNYAIYKSGPDVSEVGSTWLSNLVSMLAIRPFSDSDVRKIGRETSFVKGAWDSGIRSNQVFGIPWRGDVRVINYRRDMLEKAGVDEKTAFSSIGNLRDTVKKLRQLDGIVPWLMNTTRHSMLVHVIAPWIWNAGGHFTSSDGHKTMFSSSEALSGIRAYFETFAPVITPDTRNLADSQTSEMFMRGRAAAVISGHWITDTLYQQNSDSLVKRNLGVALTPGAQYSGSMNLVIWNHSVRSNDALRLVQFLTMPEIQAKFIPQAGLLPVRMGALNQPPYTTDPNYKMLKESLITGRHLNAAYMWGIIEDQLATAFHSIWQTLFDDPQVDLDDLLASRLIPLAERIDRKLSIQI